MDLSGLVSPVLQLLSPVVLAALTWLAARVNALIRARVQNEYLRGVLLRLDDAVFAAVRELHQVVVEGMKSASADGRLTPEQKLQIKARAIATIKSHLSPRGLKEAAEVFGLRTDMLDQVLSTRVEAAVHDLKRARFINGSNPGGDVVPFAP
jgi:hypothetical protein